MQIIILGSSAETALPRMKNGRIAETPVELSRDPKDKRTRASIAIKFPKDDTYLVVDATPDFWLQIYRAGIQDKIKAIILTSALSHHSQGLYQHHLPVLTFASRQTWAELPDVKIPHNFRRTIDKPIISLHGLQIFPFDVSHMALNNEGIDKVRSFGLRIFDEVSGQTLVYIPDYQKIPMRSRPKAISSDLLILDGITLDKTYNEHSTIRQQIAFAKTTMETSNVWFTSIGHDTLPHKELRAKIKEKFDNSGVCHDGLKLTLESGRLRVNE
jgi:phosphoribosyl 1,2-cyclic phosphodiesterase